MILRNWIELGIVIATIILFVVIKIYKMKKVSAIDGYLGITRREKKKD